MTLINCESLKEISEMACVTSARYSREQTYKNFGFQNENLIPDFEIPHLCPHNFVTKVILQFALRRMSARIFREHAIVFQSMDQVERYDTLKLLNEHSVLISPSSDWRFQTPHREIQ